ncbi:hypothetical protein IP79_06360 [Porphyrobacter sp. AAP60]|nr:hypothetical protein IP79_06360 [Porphyrobacter sp. AAP60]
MVRSRCKPPAAIIREQNTSSKGGVAGRQTQQMGGRIFARDAVSRAHTFCFAVGDVAVNGAAVFAGQGSHFCSLICSKQKKTVRAMEHSRFVMA